MFKIRSKKAGKNIVGTDNFFTGTDSVYNSLFLHVEKNFLHIVITIVSFHI